MDEFFIQQLKDYFTPCELVDLLEDDITVEDLIYALDDTIARNEDVLKEYMQHGR